MKRFLVFASSTYYPAGGWYDFIGDFDSYEEARAAGEASRNDWWQVIDSETKNEAAGP